MKRIAMFFNWMPFCGKWSIKEFVVDVISSTSRENLKSSLMKFYALMAVFVPAHLAQGFGGARLFASKANLLVSAYGLLYCAANFCAVIVQTYTTLRITSFALRRWTPAKYKHEYNAPPKEQAVSIIFTLTCQIIFIALAAVYI